MRAFCAIAHNNLYRGRFMDDKTNTRIKFLVNMSYYLVIATIVYFVLKYVTEWIMPFLLAFILVSIVHPVINKLTRIFKLKHSLVAVVVMFILYGLTGYGVFWIIARIIRTMRDLFSSLPSYYENTIVPLFNKIISFLTNTSLDLPFDIDFQFSDILGNALSTLQSVMTSISQGGVAFVASVTNNVPSFLIAFIFMIMLSFFISVQYDRVLLFMKAQLNERGRRMVSDFKRIFIDTVLKYLQAYLKLMCVTFTELSIGFYFIGLENPFAAAAIIAVFDALPLLGTGGVIVPWIIIELIQANYQMAMGLAILYGVVLLVRNLIEPKIVGDQLGLNPIVSLISIYLGLRIFGVLGMIAMPVTVQIVIAMQKNGNIHIFNEIE
jgi:sporulation integral membrane protein YtvI